MKKVSIIIIAIVVIIGLALVTQKFVLHKNVLNMSSGKSAEAQLKEMQPKVMQNNSLDIANKTGIEVVKSESFKINKDLKMKFELKGEAVKSIQSNDVSLEYNNKILDSGKYSLTLKESGNELNIEITIPDALEQTYKIVINNK